MKALYMFLLSVVCYGNMKDNVDLGGERKTKHNPKYPGVSVG